MRGRREDEFRGFPFSRRVVAPMRGCRAAAVAPASESPWPPKTVGGYVAVVLIATAACFTRPVEATSPQPNMWSPNEEPFARRWKFQSWLGEFNKEYLAIKHEEAEAAWDASVKITSENQDRLKDIQHYKEVWKDAWCDEAPLNDSIPLDYAERRQLWFMCRGPRYSSELSSSFEEVQQELYRLYHATEVCGLDDDGDACEHGEPDLARRMERERDPERLRRTWEAWHDAVGTPRARSLYARMVRIMNEAARNNGYTDASEPWKESLDFSSVVGGAEAEAQSLYRQVLPLYRLLHAYVRHRLRMHYGQRNIRPQGHIPAHLLGNMWAQTWSSVWDIVRPEEFRKPSQMPRRRELFGNMTVLDMVERAEDFYVSMGFDPMTAEFWRNSQFVKPPLQKSESTSCHPSSLDMSNGGDFRMELCGDQSEDTFITLHHEMGHIQYYMNYADRDPLFRDGASPAFHEAVGDTSIYAVQTPAHLARLALVSRLLRQALYKIPLIAWSLVVDRWRWSVFQGRTRPTEFNEAWWALREGVQGVRAPRQNRRGRFDAMAKFHIPDNTPYMPYFFSSFLQLQLFESLCRIEFGEGVDLHRCDLYGAKRAGEKFREMLSLGQSRPWPEALAALTGKEGEGMSAEPLLEYYRPLQEWLERKVGEEEIPVGW